MAQGFALKRTQKNHRSSASRATYSGRAYSGPAFQRQSHAWNRAVMIGQQLLDREHEAPAGRNGRALVEQLLQSAK